MAKQRGNSGFTMMEMMLALLLVSIILSLSIPHLPEYKENDPADEIDSISYVFQGAQMNALAAKESFIVLMEHDIQTITVRDKARRIISSYELKTCRLENYGMNNFTYKENGDTNAFGTVYLSCEGKIVKFIFQIQKGRFRIEQ
ncbi:MAG: prepilin-type N-terminal cleavage/methylation domain-containing protein [Jeotgalicoccus sp.]